MTYLQKIFFYANTLFIAFFIMGCAGTQFTWEQARKIQVGMSEKELTSLMGAPYMVKSQPEQTLYIWSYSDGFTGARAISVPLKDNKVISAPQIPDSFQ